MTNYLGIDFGTSGARAIVIDRDEDIIFESNIYFPNVSSNNWTEIWQKTLFDLIESIPLAVRQKIERIAIDGTSSTVLLCNSDGNPIAEPIFYNDDRGKICLKKIRSIAPKSHLVISVTSSLAKLFWFSEQSYFNKAKYLLHQADWLAFLLHKKLGISDYHNALKLGYDTDNLCYPNWLTKLPFFELFPQVLTPGTSVAEVDRKISSDYNLAKNCLICAGTTDSIAAFLASGAHRLGEAVTSLGSTLVLKLLSQIKVEDTNYGIYSHRFGDLWLTGGASNAGGAVLKYFFSDRELVEYSAQIDPKVRSNLSYYPLLKKGERFPINDSGFPPQIEPIPNNKVELLYGLLSGLARIEALGYQRLVELGTTPIISIHTSGGGAKNPTWQLIRQGYLNYPISIAKQVEAAYGTALLAKREGLS
jgi:D-ribulokinase